MKVGIRKTTVFVCLSLKVTAMYIDCRSAAHALCQAMPWTIPNLILHDKPARLGNMRSHGRNCVFVVCGNPDCHHNAEIDASGFPDEICNTGCSAQCAIIAAPTLARHGCIMADWAREFDEPIPASKGRQLVTLRDAAEYIQKLPEAEQLFEE